MCTHRPPCPRAEASDHLAAHVVSAHPEQGWSLLCNGVITFDDGGELLPGTVASDQAGAAHLGLPRGTRIRVAFGLRPRGRQARGAEALAAHRT
jgi:hypothetical protein